MMMDQISLSVILSFIFALLVGILVGIERTMMASKEDEVKGAGIRTFALVSITGFFLVNLFEGEGLLLTTTVIIFSVLFLLIPVFRYKKGSIGLTTSGALVITLLIGMIFGYRQPFLGLVASSFLLALTSSKRILHRFAEILSREEFLSAVRFLIVAGILLPITYTLGPIHPLVGPGRVFDPLQALTMVLFVSGISFLSYLVMKTYGAKKGIQISAFIGGLVSSAAATASISQRSKSLKGKFSSALGIHLSNLSMFIKDYVIILTVGGIRLGRRFVIPLTILISITLVYVILYRKKIQREKKRSERARLDLGSPFALIPATKFGLLFSIIWVSSYYLQNYMGAYGVYMVSVGGLISTTSVSASISTLYITGEISGTTALSTMLLAFGFGSISKVLIARTSSKGLSRKITLSMLILTTTSFILVFLLNL